MLAASVTADTGYAASSGFSGDDRKAVDAFIASLAGGLGVSSDEAGRSRVRRHVPVLVSVGPNGAALHVCLPVRGPDGIALYRTVCLPAVPYAWSGSDGKYLVRFTLGEAVDVTELSTGTVSSGHWRLWCEAIPELGTDAGFRALRADTVAGVVRGLLESGLAMADDASATTAGGDAPALADHLGSGNETGVMTRFDLPDIEDATFRRAVSDIGVLAFIRGMPVGYDRTYSTFAFGGARVVRNQTLVGYEWESQRIYCREACQTYQLRTRTPGFATDALQWFTSAREAATTGYRPCSDCGR